jgi:hypothetical protein
MSSMCVRDVRRTAVCLDGWPLRALVLFMMLWHYPARASIRVLERSVFFIASHAALSCRQGLKRNRASPVPSCGACAPTVLQPRYPFYRFGRRPISSLDKTRIVNL